MVAVLALAVLSLKNPLTNPDTFPIAVWLQEPSQAAKYRAAGFNLYIGLWQGPTEAQLATLKSAEMPVVCDQNDIGLKHRNDPLIVAWMHQDEPDNAQEVTDASGKKGYGPCVPPATVVDRYRAMKAADGSRPVMLNLGQGVANDQWIGRGNGARLDDYKTYVQGCDIVSFDVYPVAGLDDAGKIPLVAKGIDRLAGWTAGKKRIWNCLECTAISGKAKATPEQVRVEAWSAIIHGSRGFIYFVHQFEPKFDEHALLDDPVMLAAVTKLNHEIQGLAPVVNRGVKVAAGPSAESVDYVALRYGGALYLIAANPSAKAVETEIRIPGGPASISGRDLDTYAEVAIRDHQVRVNLEPFGCRLFKFAGESHGR